VDSSEFSILVGKLERELDLSPRLHYARIGCIAALGYLPLAILGLTALGALGYALVAFFSAHVIAAAPIVAFVCSMAALAGIVAVLGAPVYVEEGRDLRYDEAPALFAAIDDVSERTATRANSKSKTLDVAAIALDGSFDCTLRIGARWGLFGRYTYRLEVGVPLLMALTLAEIKALVAHEMGHFVGEARPFARWVYRQRIVWRAIEQRLQEPDDGLERVVGLFYRWYAGFFVARTFAVARQVEYLADRTAAKATHPGALANALTKIALMGRFLDEVFWPRLLQQVENNPEPPYLPFAMMARAFGLARKQWARQDWLDRALRNLATEGSTKPSLADRFAALNIEPAPPAYSPERSALALFKENSQAVLKWCDEEWRAENLPVWRERHKAIGELRWKIAEYEKLPREELKGEDLWQKSLLIVDLGDFQAAIEELQLLVAREPNMAKAHLLLGKLLLQHGNELGLQNLALAAQYDAAMVEDAGGVGYSYLVDRGRKGEAQRFWDRVRAA
jgi:Zn-dependent protease with chaperone function